VCRPYDTPTIAIVAYAEPKDHRKATLEQLGCFESGVVC
jgi:hypothetical protein